MVVATQQVLVVEDDTDIREAIVDLLRDEGYTVLEVTEGKAAFHQLRRSAAVKNGWWCYSTG